MYFLEPSLSFYFPALLAYWVSISNLGHLHVVVFARPFPSSSSSSFNAQRAARERELEGLASAAASALRAPRATSSSSTTNDEDGPMPPSSEPPSTAAATSFAEGLGCANPVFDESGHFVAYTTLTGIKVGLRWSCCCLEPSNLICTLKHVFASLLFKAFYCFFLFASHFPLCPLF